MLAGLAMQVGQPCGRSSQVTGTSRASGTGRAGGIRRRLVRGIGRGVVALTATVTAAAAIGAILAPDSGHGPRRGSNPAVRPAAFDPASYRLGYTAKDRQTLVAAVPGQPATSALGNAAGDADFDADVRGDTTVWISRRGANRTGQLYLRRGTAAPIQLTDDAATIRHPAVSPDGTRVAFTSDRGGSDDIWIIDVPAGSAGSGNAAGAANTGTGIFATPRRLTDHPGCDTWPTWSPDGSQLAFSSTRDDPAGEIYTMPAAGGTPMRLTTDPAADTEPAWSPDGKRLAFTTSRFRQQPDQHPRSRPLGDVVTVPATGGEVTRAVPSTIDSAEPAWAPDNRRLAFTSFTADPAGDVYTVDGNAVTTVAADASRSEDGPTWRGTKVVYQSTDQADTTDIWSADSGGGDRRDLTAGPGVDEHGPAYTADGSRLAYSIGVSGGERIVAADADGRNPRVLAPQGTRPGDRDSDPTWSPDGTMLAFSRTGATSPDPDQGDAGNGPTAQSQSRVLVVRASDGAKLGELPVPANLHADDQQPAWSPDGLHIALARRSSDRYSRVDPPWVDQPLRPDQTFDQAVSVLTPDAPAAPATPDIVFFLDVTSSLQGVLEDLKTKIVDVVGQVRKTQPNASFAMVVYRAEGYNGEAGDTVYQRVSDLVDGEQAGEMLAARLKPIETKDQEGIYRESWYNALVQAFNGDDDHRVHLRSGSSPTAVVIGDSPSTGNTRYPPGNGPALITQQEVINLLNSDSVHARLVAVPVRTNSPEAGLDADDNVAHAKEPGPNLEPDDADTTGEATEIATATGGVVTAGADPAKVTDAIVHGIATKPSRASVTPRIEHCDQGLDVTFDPQRSTVDAGQRARLNEKIKLSASATPGSVLGCTVLFAIDPPVADDEVRQRITVRVAGGDRPFVRVDDVTAQATGAEGAKVDYQASTVSASGKPLPAPTCSQASGSVFPVGQTVVTCTATHDGQTGSDVAVITVVDPAAKGRRIWVTDIQQNNGQISFGTQRDVSSRVGAPCQARGTTGNDPGDRAPAWSPDSTRLAFTDSAGSTPGLCVVDASGGDAHSPAGPTPSAGGPVSSVGGVADPTWSPDGAQIAFTCTGASGPAAVCTVPSTGGTPVAVVRTAGGATQPVYRMLPARDLSVTVSVSGHPAFVGGDPITVTYTVRNGSANPATNVYLSPTLPVSLGQLTRVDSPCDAAASVCQFGTLSPGDQVVVTVVLTPRGAASGTVAGRVTGTVGDRAPISHEAGTPVAVLQPALTVNPLVGPPGFVTRAKGADFPPGAVVRLVWDTGLTAAPETVTVAQDGTFDSQRLVMRKDELGPRYLRAELVTGSRFAPVRTAKPFLVVPRQLDPPVFNGRN